MPKMSPEELVALFRAHGATTWPEVVSLAKSLGWRVVPGKGLMELLKGPGGTSVISSPGEVKLELQALQVRAIAADGDPPDLVELPRNEEGEN